VSAALSRIDGDAVGGFIDGPGGPFRSFRIKDLELVDLTRASWNRWHFWLRQLASLREAV